MIPGLAIGRIAWYRSKTGLYTCPAMITATCDTLYLPNVEAGHVAPLSGENHVHLNVFTPGKPGHVSDETMRDHVDLVAAHAPGLYQELDIPYWDSSAAEAAGWEYSAQPPGTWTWPVRL